MQAEINMRDEQLQDLDEALEELFEKLPKSKRKALDIDEIKDKLHEYTNALDSFKMEIRTQNQADKSTFKGKAKKYAANLKKFKGDLEWQETQMNKADLMDGYDPEKGADMKTADGMMQHGLSVQQESKESLQRTLQTANEALDIGKETAVKLEQQTEQLTRVYDDLGDIDGTLNRSRAIIKRMARKMRTDRYLWGVFILCMLAIAGLIIWKIVDPEADVVVPDVLTKKHEAGLNGGEDGQYDRRQLTSLLGALYN